MNPVQNQDFKLAGVVVDVPAAEVPQDKWSGASNVYFDDHGTKRIGGLVDFADTTPIVAAHIMPLPTELTYFWIYMGLGGVFVFDGLIHHDITPAVFTGDSDPATWTSSVLNGLAVMNCGNDIDVPFFWDGVVTNICQPIPDWPANTTCRAMRAFKYHLFAMNITQNGVQDEDLVLFSDAADPNTIPQEWTPSATNEAGSNTLSDSDGQIIDAEKLRDQFLMYKSGSMYLISYVAGTFVFNFRKLRLNTGIQSRNCVVELDGYHFVLTQDDFIKHDGQQSQSLLDAGLRNLLFGSLSTQFFDAACVAVRHSRDEIWIAFPTDQNKFSNLALIYNYREDLIGIRGLPEAPHIAAGIVANTDDRSYDGQTDSYETIVGFYNQANFSQSADLMIVSNSLGLALSVADTVTTNLGEPVVASVTREGLEFGQEDNQKYIPRIWPRISGTGGDVVHVRVGGQLDWSDPISWCPRQDYIIDETRKVDVNCSGKLVSVEFSSSGGQPWRIDGFGIDYVDKGRF